jgi:hypothetical protein
MSELPASRRAQHVVPNALITTLAVVIAWISFTQEPAGSYLFPRLVSVIMVALAAWSLVRALMGISKVGSGVSAEMALNLTPGLVLIFVYVFWAAKTLGFYTSSAAAFFLLFTIYDPTPVTSVRGWALRIVVTAGFMAVIYALFTLLLQVQVPRGLFL